MSLRNDEFLRKAKITLYYDEAAKRILPYCKVQPFDDVSGHDTNQEYYVPFQLNVGLVDKMDEPFQVVIEKKSGGAFPSDLTKGQAVGSVAIHQYGAL